VTGKGPFDPREEAPLLSAYVDGEIDPVDRARLEAHLAEETPASAATRREIEQLRRLNAVTGALRLKEPPPEVWETFWQGVYNRAERSAGWILLGAGVILVAAWAALRLATVLWNAEALPLWVRGGIFTAAAGVLVLLVSAVRERIYRRGRTRYKDVIR
jgi:anti-sigma factor RsiW